jgi:hypothetical protein
MKLGKCLSEGKKNHRIVRVICKKKRLPEWKALVMPEHGDGVLFSRLGSLF